LRTNSPTDRDRRSQPPAGRFFGRFTTSATSGLARAADAAAVFDCFARIRASPVHANSLIGLTLMSQPTTLYDKIWNDHLVHEAE